MEVELFIQEALKYANPETRQMVDGMKGKDRIWFGGLVMLLWLMRAVLKEDDNLQ